MNKENTKFDGLYISKYSKKSEVKGHLIYVHGGPGNNSALFELFVKETLEYHDFDYGWVFYDQRGCGRSDQENTTNLSHISNIDDLNNIINYCSKGLDLNIVGVVGHSYGARLIHDVMIKYNPNILPIMIGVASSFKTAKKKSLVMDLLNLKFNQAESYQNVILDIDQYGDEIWKNAKLVRDQLKDLNLRKLFYWGNLDALNRVSDLKKKLNIEETNQKTFSIVRDKLHDDPLNYIGPNPDKFLKRYLWINGIHDFLMAGELMDYENKGILSFYRSGHYPHMEEPKRFLFELKLFLEKSND